MMNFVHELQVYDSVVKNIIYSRACCWTSYKRSFKYKGSTKELLFKECQEFSKRAEQELNIYTVEIIGERDFWRQMPWKYFKLKEI